MILPKFKAKSSKMYVLIKYLSYIQILKLTYSHTNSIQNIRLKDRLSNKIFANYKAKKNKRGEGKVGADIWYQGEKLDSAVVK